MIGRIFLIFSVILTISVSGCIYNETSAGQDIRYCGDNECNLQENYDDCPDDCKPPMELGEHIFHNYDSISADGTYVIKKSSIRETDYQTKSVGPVYPIIFNSEVENVHLTSKCVVGDSVVFDFMEEIIDSSNDGSYYYKFETYGISPYNVSGISIFRCDKGECTLNTLRDAWGSRILKASKGAKGSLSFQLVFHDKDNTYDLECTINIISDEPKMTLTEQFTTRYVFDM